jgi:tetratricopeptide (TPR) repeat protein
LQRASIYESINDRLAADDIDGAIDLAEVAITLGQVQPLALNLCAFRLEKNGDFQGALKLLDQALQLDPNDVTVLNAIGHVWLKQAMPLNALRAFAAALEREAGYAPAHHGAGLALWGLGDLAESRAAQRRAAELDAHYPDPRGALALLALHEKDQVSAREYALQALALDPAEPSAFLTLATLDEQAGQHEAVAERVAHELAQANVAPLQRAPLYRLYGDALDALGRFDEAFAAYSDGNAIQRRMFAPQHSGPDVETATGLCRRIAEEFENDRAKFPPSTELDAGPEVNHVFLVGFPRSGTTLLEQILASHHNIVALEEKPTLNEEISEFFLDHDSLQPLVELSDDDLRRRVDAYWARIAGYGLDVAGKTFVDKQPSLTIYLPLVARLFPKAKIIFARRDPRDVVLSCFRRGFNMNRTIYDFTDLERLSTYYSAVMDLAETFFEALPLAFHIHTHEAMIADFDGEIARLCAAIGVEFDENMHDFVETAKRRDIRTPSAPQILKGMNASGVGYWRNYAQHLAPVTPILQPWIDKFGYE